MAFPIRSLAAWAIVLALVIGSSSSTRAAIGSVELPVTLTIFDVCTLDTNAHQPAVACSAGGQYRILTDEYFASFQVADVRHKGNPSIVEIAF
jgi:hypothetical protein